jgi:hypothetical protein
MAVGSEAAWTETMLPLFGGLTAIELPYAHVEISPSVTLHRTFSHVFSAPMMAFEPPKAPAAAHPAPWVAVRGGFTFESKVELAITDKRELGDISPRNIAWLIAVVLRLQVPVPIRLAVIGNMPFAAMGTAPAGAVLTKLDESAPYQLGWFETQSATLSDEDLSWLKGFLPAIAQLCLDDRFYRALTVYDQAQWSASLEMGSVLLWTAIEILFHLSGEREKTKAISRSVADYIGSDSADVDRAYGVVRDLYYQRGRVVHAGQPVTHESVAQSFQIAKVCFRRALIEGELPPARG